MPVCDQDFQALYDAFHDRILRYLSRLVGPSEAEDLTQEVFLKISRALSGFRGDAQLSTWVYRIATHTAIDRLRTPAFRQAEASTSFDDDFPSTGCLAPEPALPDQVLMRREMVDCFDTYVNQLPSPYRAVLVLSDLEELPNREIADILGLTLDTVKIRLHRGRALLFQQLHEHCKAEDWL